MRSIAADRPEVLWVTSGPAAPLVNGAEVVFVTTVPRPNALDPKRLQDVRAVVQRFLDAHPAGLVVLDCLDALALHNGVERLLRVVQDLHDAVSTRAANLIVVVDALRSNPRLLAMLARELDELPDGGPAASPDLLVV